MFLMMVKNLPANAGDSRDSGLSPGLGRSPGEGNALGQEDPLEKEMAIHSNVLAWAILWAEEPGGYSPWGRRVGHN